MSRASAAVRFPDGKIMVTLYNGTVDVLFGKLLDSADVHEAWQQLYPIYKGEAKGDLHPQCTCGQSAEQVQVATDYGGGFEWRARACRRCMCVTDGSYPYYTTDSWGPPRDDPDDMHMEDGLPDWWPAARS